MLGRVCEQVRDGQRAVSPDRLDPALQLGLARAYDEHVVDHRAQHAVQIAGLKRHPLDTERIAKLGKAILPQRAILHVLRVVPHVRGGLGHALGDGSLAHSSTSVSGRRSQHAGNCAGQGRWRAHRCGGCCGSLLALLGRLGWLGRGRAGGGALARRPVKENRVRPECCQRMAPMQSRRPRIRRACATAAARHTDAA